MPPKSDKRPEPHRGEPRAWQFPLALVLRRRDRQTLTILLSILLLAVAGYWVASGGHRGELIDIEQHPEPLPLAFRVDINEAAWPELAQLPGIGETLAKRIVDHRAAQGEFLSHEQLRDVRGIGPLTLDRLRPFLLPLADPRNVADR